MRTANPATRLPNNVSVSAQSVESWKFEAIQDILRPRATSFIRGSWGFQNRLIQNVLVDALPSCNIPRLGRDRYQRWQMQQQRGLQLLRPVKRA
jgi:hypothetical protein